MSSASFVYLGSGEFLITIGAVCSLELQESDCLLIREGLTEEGAGFFFQSNQGDTILFTKEVLYFC